MGGKWRNEFQEDELKQLIQNVYELIKKGISPEYAASILEELPSVIRAVYYTIDDCGTEFDMEAVYAAVSRIIEEQKEKTV